MIFRSLFRPLIVLASLLLLAPSTFAAEARSLSSDDLYRSACVMVKANITGRGSRQSIASATGSGFFVTPDLILTCNHCTRIPMPQGIVDANDVQVELDGGKFVRARVIARDPAHDLALLRVDAAAAKEAGARPLSLSRFNLNSGSAITIVGNFPEAIRVTRGQLLTRNIMRGFAMGNAKVRSGFSGGPVISEDGSVQGILSQRDDDNNSIFVRSDVILSLLGRHGRPATTPVPAILEDEKDSNIMIADVNDLKNNSPSMKPAATSEKSASETADASSFQPAATTTRPSPKPFASGPTGDAPLIVALPVRPTAQVSNE